jgi:hypothetical protein
LSSLGHDVWRGARELGAKTGEGWGLSSSSFYMVGGWEGRRCKGEWLSNGECTFNVFNLSVSTLEVAPAGGEMVGYLLLKGRARSTHERWRSEARMVVGSSGCITSL